jgi:hypothetical protein
MLCYHSRVRSPSPSSQANASSTCESGLIGYLGGSPDEPRTTYAVKHDDKIAGLWHSAHDLRYTGRTVFRGSAGDLRPLGHDATKSENLAASFRGLLVLHEITYG